MANKITQLVNKNGDNLYPLAGGMAADSITTQMLKNGAVTAAKIASGAVPIITMSTTDIGEGVDLPANTLYGVYE